LSSGRPGIRDLCTQDDITWTRTALHSHRTWRRTDIGLRMSLLRHVCTSFSRFSFHSMEAKWKFQLFTIELQDSNNKRQLNALLCRQLHENYRVWHSNNAFHIKLFLLYRHSIPYAFTAWLLERKVAPAFYDATRSPKIIMEIWWL